MRYLFIAVAFYHVGLYGQHHLLYENHIYKPSIHSVLVYPDLGDMNDVLKGAVTHLGDQNLILTFDDLQEDRVNYYARLLHCNYDWTPSTLRDLDFSMEYNEHVVTDYVYSTAFRSTYVHYRFSIPRVKLPGNYLLMVYEDGNREALVLTYRLLVVEPRVKVITEGGGAGALTLRSSNQQIQFMIDYQGMQILNPFQSVHAVVRQNQRWDNARIDVKPSFIREDLRQIEYRLFEEDKYFNAGNEFRFFDFRSLNYPGQNTDRVTLTRPPQLWIQQDKPRTHDAYAQFRDLNGKYVIDNRDAGAPEESADYALTTFTLAAPELDGGKVFVVGDFNLWARDQESQMTYDSNSGVYQNSQLLKQGWYNYYYYVESANQPPYYFEGSHYQTENQYEILIYYRAFQPNADLLVGYSLIPVNER